MFNSSRFFGLKTAITLGLLLVLGLAGDALAKRNYAMSGEWLAQRGSVGIPLQFVLTNTTTPLAKGKHNNPIGFPNGNIMGAGTVSATGSSPAALTLPTSIFSSSASYAEPGFPLPGAKNVQITTNFSQIRAPGKNLAGTQGGSAMFFKNGGPGSLTFCPRTFGKNQGQSAAICPGLGNPPQGGSSRNGRVIVEQIGGNKFGGVMRMFLGGSGLVTRPRPSFGFGAGTFQAGHNVFGGGGGDLQVGGGGKVGTMTWAHETNKLPGGPFTQPLIKPTTNGVIPLAKAGPKITVSGQFSACPAGFNGGAGGATTIVSYTNFSKCTPGAIGSNTSLLVDPTATTTNTGFPFTTGRVFAQQNTNTGAGFDYFTATGSDNRTVMGVGDITLVAGGLSIRQSIGGLLSTGSMETASMQLAELVPTMSKTGFAAAAALMVIAVGYAFRRRF